MKRDVGRGWVFYKPGMSKDPERGILIEGIDEIPTTPEEMLWRAVLSQTFHDFNATYEKIKKIQGALGFAPTILKVHINEIIEETKSEWFRDICNFANIDTERATSRVAKEYERLKIAEIPFKRRKICCLAAIELLKTDRVKAKCALAEMGLHHYTSRTTKRFGNYIY